MRTSRHRLAEFAASRWQRLAMGMAAVLFLALGAGCVSNPTPAYVQPHSSPALSQWVDNELAPHLRRLIGSHPRLQRQTFAVVRMAGGDIQPRIDGLTLDLRRRLTDAMAADPAVRMAWLPSADPRHHRRLSPADCADSLRADYFIGIESSAAPDGRRRIAVRLLDAKEGGWVDGLGASWRGRLQPGEERAMRESQDDELLRGLRVLPFTASQPDLTAAYFANNLSCLIRQRGLSEKRLHVVVPEQGPPQLNTAFALLDNYLSRLHQVRITRQPSAADYLVRAELHRIDDQLYQVWIGLEPRGSGEHVAGLDTAAYVRLNGAFDALAGARGDRPVHLDDAGRRSTAASLKARPRITRLRLLRASSPDICERPGREIPGAHPVLPAELLDPADCLLVDAAAADAERLFLLYQTPERSLTRLTPGHCGDGDSGVTLLPVPAPDAGGDGTLYALAVSDGELEYSLLRHLRQLPDGCLPHAISPLADAEHWTRRLDELLAARPGSSDWTALRLRFAEPSRIRASNAFAGGR